MKQLNIDPSEALPILDHKPTKWLENMARSGKWNDVPRAEVFVIPEGHLAKTVMGATYIVYHGLKRRATAQKYKLPYRVNVIEEGDMPDFYEELENTLRNASDYYYGMF